MIYHHLFGKTQKNKVDAAIIGTGHFGKAIVTQQNVNQYLDVRIVLDTNLEAARNSFLEAGIPEENIRYTGSVSEARKWYEEGKFIYTDVLDLDLFRLDEDRCRL